MVVIITGATHTGKTRLAQLMMEKYRYPYVSEDHLKMGLIRSGYTDLTPEDDCEMTVYLWPIIREMIKTVIENKQDLIVEGCYIPFDWKADFSDEYLNHIRCICLCLSDHYIDTHFAEIRQYASCIETRLENSDLTAEYLKRENRYYYEGCQEHDLDVVRIEKDYTETIDKACLSRKVDDEVIANEQV